MVESVPGLTIGIDPDDLPNTDRYFSDKTDDAPHRRRGRLHQRLRESVDAMNRRLIFALILPFGFFHGDALAETTEAEENAEPGTAELADKIKALKAANTIEATPQRARQKHSTAEEPITARIRRRQEANTVAGEAVQADAESGAGEAVQLADENSPGEPPMTFQERIALERRRKDREPSLS